MKVKYCTDEFLEEYKTNFDSYIPLYRNKDNEGLDSLFNNENIRESQLSFKYTPLKTSQNSDNPERENIKIVYESLKHLSPNEAVQEKLWVAMYNIYYREHLYDYVDNIKKAKNFNNRLKSSVVFTWGQNRSQIVQNISRMWWIGYYIYDEESEDPYELLDFYTSTKDIVGKTTAFFSSNLTNNKEIALGILSGIKELVDNEIITNVRKYYVAINRHFNLIGGVRVLDFMSREEAKNETIKVLKDIKAEEA